MCLSTEKNFLAYMDILGGKINYKINKKLVFRNAFGGFLSIILLLVAALVSYYFTYPFITRGVPRIAFENYKTHSPTPYDLSENGFFLAYRVNFPGVTEEEVDKLFTVKAYFEEVETKEGVETTRSTAISSRNSLKEDFVNTQYIYVNNKLQDAKTLIFPDEMQIGGSSISTYYSSVKVELNLLSTTDITYLNTVKTFLNENKKGSFSVYYKDLALMLTNYTSPVSNFISFYSDNISFSDKKSTNLEFSVNNITIDNSYFFENNVDSFVHLLRQETVTKINPREDSDSTLYSIKIQLAKVRSNYLRTYMKVEELLANMMGILTCVFFTFSLLNSYVNDYMLHIRLMENLFSFDRSYNNPPVETKQKVRVNKVELSNLYNDNTERKFKNIEKDNEVNLNYVNNDNMTLAGEATNTNKKKVYTRKVVAIKPNQRSKFDLANNLPFFDGEDALYNRFLCCCKPKPNTKRFKKNALYRKAKDQMNSYMDIIKVTKKLMEVDFLKYLIMNRDQLNLCHLLGRPYITLREEELSKNKFSHTYLDYARVTLLSEYEMKNMQHMDKENILLSYEVLLKKENPSIIDRKVLDSSEDNLELVQR